MTERSFPGAFRRLLRAFHRYHDVPRDPERVLEKAAARSELDDARTEVREARGGDRHVDPPTPDYVEPGLGTQSRTVAGMVAAVVFVLIAIGVLVLVAQWFGEAGGRPVELVEGSVTQEITPTATDACRWDVAADLRNTTDGEIVIRSARVDTRVGLATLVDGGIELPPGAATSVAMTFVVPGPCPGDIADLSPGRIRVNEGASSGSRFVDFTVGL